MRKLILLLALLVLSGCQTSRPQVLLRPTELGSVAWADIKGLTQDEIRAKLGIERIGESIARSARLEGEVVVSRISLDFDFAEKPCAPQASGSFSYVGFSHGGITLVFRDFLLAEVEQTTPAAATIGLDSPLVARCWVRDRTSLVDTLSNGQTAGMIVPALVLSPVLVAGRLAANSEQAKRARTFAELRLGEAPPGGLDAWARLHSDFVTVSRDATGRTIISAAMPAYRQFGIGPQALLLDGRVVELRNGSGAFCALQVDRSFLCGL